MQTMVSSQFIDALYVLETQTLGKLKILLMLFSFCCFNPSWLVARRMSWLPLLLILNVLTEKRSMFLLSYKVTLSDLGLWDLPWGLVERRNEGSWAWRQAPIHSSLISKRKSVLVRARSVSLWNVPEAVAEYGEIHVIAFPPLNSDRS